MDGNETPELLTPSEVARMMRVNPKTVTRWAKAGKLPAIKTIGGHRRFRRSDVEQAVAEAGGIYAEGTG
jgi:excisionase family DNA binding protein